jgi:NAD(P)H-dependent flavin oxidoreductase YrpB (nitropropane dioxygenase family)
MQTPFTKLLGIKYPVLLAGMANISMPKLAAVCTPHHSHSVLTSWYWAARHCR